MKEKNITLKGISTLVPRSWRHHALRFEASTGLVEYLLDGRPEAAAYATLSGREDGTVACPDIAKGSPMPLILGEGFTGFIDEFTLARASLEEIDLSTYPSGGGWAETGPLDLGYGGSLLKTIEARSTAPGDSGVFFYYKLEESLEALPHAEWKPFIPGAPLTGSREGRYALIKMELFPNGRKTLSPRVAELTLVYEKNEPPPPPSRVTASPGDGKVELRWSAVPNSSLSGYYVYYGSRPGVYDGDESSLGPSPIKLGKETQLTLTGLANGKLYYFSITSYDKFMSRADVRFSRETSARPSRVYHNEG
jgi:hypothetical protein